MLRKLFGGRKAVADFRPQLRAAIDAARAAGFGDAADELASRCFDTAYTTSTEMLGEQGLAIRAFLRENDGLPPEVVRALKQCLREIARV